MTGVKLIALGGDAPVLAGCEAVTPRLQLRGRRAVDRVCNLIDAELARDRRPIVLFGAGAAGPVAHRAAARSRRPIGLIATTLAARRPWWRALAPQPAPEPHELAVCPVLLAHCGTADIAPSRRLFDRITARKRMVIVSDPQELVEAVSTFVFTL